MGRHGRNNTSRADFTYAEREMANSGSKRGRLGRDSMKNFDACSLCLRHARDPRICPDGHVFCQECILTSLLDQKKDIKRQQVLLERMRSESEAEMATARAAARERVLKEFESAQSSLGSAGRSGASSSSSSAANGGATKAGEGGPRGTKRVFELDEDEIERLTQEKTDEALSKTAQDMAEARKAKLPNFWLPSLTPSATPDAIIDVKLQTLCHAGKRPHPVNLKQLTTVKFTEDPVEKTSSGSPVVQCPSCRKSITNNVKAFVLKACGHVLCSTCVDTLCSTDKQCAHCASKLDKKVPYIPLASDGTGFASGGGVEVSRYDVKLV
ncbi:hypothetical protein JCM3775_005285 [Rhodotorula graminis]|uniref:RING-type domain-containing protein n=1 Tax=Rhodotorula graminis (strain WP1) TaxID=578459 RepID=A0A194S141_RHOGW|nr:uncharacterized protein RHOBADRAFT_66563 [Rhodotorula graminis WP1]KPV74249.1 hypothetical protein RHOBADRAFT_66563 [Rhodotorula graminis WP1]